jgi:hypothetical protein
VAGSQVVGGVSASQEGGGTGRQSAVSPTGLLRGPPSAPGPSTSPALSAARPPLHRPHQGTVSASVHALGVQAGRRERQWLRAALPPRTGAALRAGGWQGATHPVLARPRARRLRPQAAGCLRVACRVNSRWCVSADWTPTSSCGADAPSTGSVSRAQASSTRSMSRPSAMNCASGVLMRGEK